MQKIKTWDVLQDHPIAKLLDIDTQLALLCEYIDLADELEGMDLGEFIDVYFAPADTSDQAKDDEDEDEPAASNNGAAAEADARPVSMVGMRVVYRFPGRNVLSDEEGVTRDSGGTVTFTDADGEIWSNVVREKVHPIKPYPQYHHEIHISPREAKEIKGWLAGTPAKGQPEGALLRSMFIDFPGYAERIAFAIMNGKRPYVDRFVQLPNNGFEDDQKPTTRFFGDHCFRVRGEDHVVNVVTP